MWMDTETGILSEVSKKEENVMQGIGYTILEKLSSHLRFTIAGSHEANTLPR